MYKIVEELFQSLYGKYLGGKDPMTKYAYYLKAVKKDGTALFKVPQVYRTNELIMTALESSDKPIHLMTRCSLEKCISNEREILSKYNPRYKNTITDKEHESYLCDLPKIISFKYDTYFSKNYDFEEKNLYTFIDFFRAVSEYYGGMDAICYVYLYRGNAIPIKIKINGRKSNFKLIYNSEEKILHIAKASANEYKILKTGLSQKLENYYGKSSQLDEYYWEDSPTEQTDIPILQDGDFYEAFKTTEENGVLFDFAKKIIFKIPNDIVDFSIPEGVSFISERCFMGNNSLKIVRFPSTLSHIYEAAFLNCESLEEIDMSQVDANDYSRIIVGSAAFCNCKSLKNIDMSKLKLEDGAELTFAYCFGIKDISKLEIPRSGKKQMNFFHCENISTLIKDHSVEYGDFDLAYCRNIRKIRTFCYAIPTGLCCGCDSLESLEITRIGYWRKEFGDYCFAGCKSLKEIDTLDGGARIGKYAFADCNNLTKIILNKKEDGLTVISETAFEGSPRVQLKWVDTSPMQESIADYWKRKGIELNNKKQQEKNEGIKAKDKYIKLLNDYFSNKNAIGEFFKKRGRYIGMEMNAILKYEVCSWEEFMSIGRLFYECIPFSNMEDYGDVRSTIVSWAKSCAVQAYLKAPIHNKFDAIKLIYCILKIAHCYFEKQTIIYGEKARQYSEIYVLNTDFDYHEFEQKGTAEQISFIKVYTTLSDIRMSYLMQYYLLNHLIDYHSRYNLDKKDFDYEKKEIDKIATHFRKFLTLPHKSLMDVCRFTWQQFIKNDIEKKYKDLGEDNIYVDRNEIDFISFDFSKMEIFRDNELIDKSCKRGVNLLIHNQNKRFNNQMHDDESKINEYGRYRGSYAQDVMGWSDDDIDTVLEGDPNAYWNID